jgi:hypothetical protein
MSTKKIIRVPEPCHENWNEMTPKEQGRHCDVCSKVVVDFRNKTKDEIISTIENTSGKTCGRFSNHQLDQETKPLKKYIYPVAASLAGLAVMLPTAAGAQNTNDEPANWSFVWNPNAGTNLAEQMVVKGQAMLSDQTPVRATIQLKQNEKAIAETFSDSSGNYTLQIPREADRNKPFVIIASYSYFRPKNIHFTPTKETTTVNFLMNEIMDVLGQPAIYIPPTPIAEATEKVQPLKEELEAEIEKVNALRHDLETVMTNGYVVSLEVTNEVEELEALVNDTTEALTEEMEWKPSHFSPKTKEVNGVMVETDSVPLEVNFTDVEFVDSEGPSFVTWGWVDIVETSGNVAIVEEETDLSIPQFSIDEEDALISEDEPAITDALSGNVVIVTPSKKEDETEVVVTQENNASPKAPQNISATERKGVLFNDRINSQIFPNPTKEYFDIEVTQFDTYHIQILDANGKLILAEKFSGLKKRIDISSFESGTYFVDVASESKDYRQIHKLIVN